MELASYLIQTAPELTERVEVEYRCPLGHTFTRIFAAQAEIPQEWDCPQCGRQAARSGHDTIASVESSVVEPTERPRTHWDMLLERRSIEELEQLLKERVAEIHSRSV